MIKRIGIIGPESTGKSTLSEQLAGHFNTQWVPEFAREYLRNIEMPYEEKDLLTIAKGQKDSEEQLAKTAADYLFCDTTLIVIKVWSEHKYGRCHPWILEQIDRMKYDYFLLTSIDLPWEPDPLREHPDRREYFFEVYRNCLDEQALPYAVVEGNHRQRLDTAIRAIEEI